MRKILIIDDEEKIRGLLARIISIEGSFDVQQAADCSSGLKKLGQADVDVVLCDVKLPDGNGIELTGEIRTKYPLTEVILLTAYGNIPDGVQAIKNGAFDYITKGDDNNKIIPLLYRAIEKVELSKRVLLLEKQLNDKYSFENILGNSKAIRKATDLAKKVAVTDTTVLLTGETGTGKEVFAQSIHQAGTRNTKNFLAVNCSAFSKDILESELFGHIAGAFTGAIKDKRGLFREADGGTIFLDEIGEMALDLQAKLLRVLETGEFIRVGENKNTGVNVRTIAATNRDLQKEIEAGRFREDLFYRLSVFQIRVPALRERINDIGLLANHFARLFAAKTNKN
jgi:DNA-binding NtrC family response regulator